MIFRRLAHTALAAAASAAILLTTLLANAAETAPAAPRCTTATYIRPSDGAIVTRTVCVVAQTKGGVR